MAKAHAGVKRLHGDFKKLGLSRPEMALHQDSLDLLRWVSEVGRKEPF
jgi:hypothetical protein